MNDQELRAIYDIVYAHECTFKAFATDIRALLADGGKGEAVRLFKDALTDRFDQYPIPTQLGVTAIMKVIKQFHEGYTAPQAECAPREAQPVADTVRECLSDVVSHYRALYAGLAFQLNEATNTENSDDMAYWKHEIKALERMYVQAESALAAPTPERAQPVGPRTTLNYDGTFDTTCAHCGGNGCFACLKSAAPTPERAEKSAKQQYDASGCAEEEPDPIERLRFFCSLAMNGQDWIDVEPFFDAITPERADADTATCPNCNGTGSHGGRFHTDGRGSSEYEPYKCDVCNGFGRVSADADKRELSWQEGYKTGYDDAETVAKHAAGASERADAEKDAALLEALRKIAAIENKMYGGDWDEIEEARSIASIAILAANKETPERAEPRALTDARAKEIAQQVHAECSRIPGATFYNAAMSAIEQAVKEPK
jgi:hypothetical protein